MTASAVLEQTMSTLVAAGDGLRPTHGASATSVRRGAQHRVRFVRVPSTGGGEAFLSQRGASFRRAIGDLPLSRPRWRMARAVLRAASWIGLQRLPLVPHVDVWLSAAEAALVPDVSVLSGVRNAAQKVIVRQHASNGPDDVIWKLGAGGRPAAAIQAEVRAYQWLERQELAGVLAPRLLGAGSAGEVRWFKASELTGPRPSLEAGREVRDFLDRLRAPAVADPRPGLTEEWAAGVRARVAQGRAAPHGGPPLHLESGLARLLAQAGGPHLPFGVAHGDLTPWNTRCEAGALRAFDWEWFSPLSSPWFDEIHWIVQTSALVRHDSAGATFGRAVAALASRGLSRRQAARAIGLYAVEVMSQGREGAPAAGPAPPQHAWLGSTRRALVERAVAEVGGASRG